MMIKTNLLFKFKTTNGRTFGTMIETETGCVESITVYFPQSKKIEIIYDDKVSELIVTHDASTYTISNVNNNNIADCLRIEIEDCVRKLGLRPNHLVANLEYNMLSPYDVLGDILSNGNNDIKCIFKYMRTNTISELSNNSGYKFSSYYSDETYELIKSPGEKYVSVENQTTQSNTGDSLKVTRCRIGKSFVMFRLDPSDSSIVYGSICVIDNMIFTFYPVVNKPNIVKMVYREFVYYDTPAKLTRIIEKMTFVKLQPKLIQKIKDSFGGMLCDVFLSHSNQTVAIIKRIPTMNIDRNGIMKFLEMLKLYEPRKFSKNVDMKYYGGANGELKLSILLEIKSLDDKTSACSHVETFFITKKNLDEYFITGKKSLLRATRNNIYLIPKCSTDTFLKPLFKKHKK